MRIDTLDIKNEPDLLQRVLLADDYMDQARAMLAELSRLRSEAIRDLAAYVGGAKAAELLNMNRPNLYRAIRNGLGKEEAT